MKGQKYSNPQSTIFTEINIDVGGGGGIQKSPRTCKGSNILSIYCSWQGFCSFCILLKTTPFTNPRSHDGGRRRRRRMMRRTRTRTTSEESEEY